MSCSMLSSREMATNISMVLPECRQMRYVVVLSKSMNNWLIKSNRSLNPSLQDMLTIHGYLIFYLFWVDQAPKKMILFPPLSLFLLITHFLHWTSYMYWKNLLKYVHSFWENISSHKFLHDMVFCLILQLPLVGQILNLVHYLCSIEVCIYTEDLNQVLHSFAIAH